MIAIRGYWLILFVDCKLKLRVFDYHFILNNTHLSVVEDYRILIGHSLLFKIINGKVNSF